MPQLEAQRCGRLVASLQLLQRYPRRRAQLVAYAAQGHGDARVEHVAQLHEEDACSSPLSLDSTIATRAARRAKCIVRSSRVLLVTSQGEEEEGQTGDIVTEATFS